MAKNQKPKRCKNICVFCQNIMGRDGELPVCSKLVTEQTDCVTGLPSITYALCKDKNKNGCCKKYDPDRERLNNERLRQDLIRYAKEDLKVCGGQYRRYETIIGYLTEQLKKELENEETDFFSEYHCGDYSIRYKYNPDEGYKVNSKAYKKCLEQEGDGV